MLHFFKTFEFLTLMCRYLIDFIYEGTHSTCLEYFSTCTFHVTLHYER